MNNDTIKKEKADSSVIADKELKVEVSEEENDETANASSKATPKGNSDVINQFVVGEGDEVEEEEEEEEEEEQEQE